MLADGQCFTPVQLERSLKQQGASAALAEQIPAELRVFSCNVKARKPSERLFKEMLKRLREHGIEPGQVLHVGNSLDRDMAPARRHGMKIALFAGDKHSLQGKAAQLNQPTTRPDVLLTELAQITEVVG